MLRSFCRRCRRPAGERALSVTVLPSHHAPGGGFRNPPEWKSHQNAGALDFVTKALPYWDFRARFTSLAVVTPDFTNFTRAHFGALWINHCTFLLALGRARVLTDPFFSDRASPVSFAGPARYTAAAATISELPALDAVCISHSHYDHLDERSVRELQRAPTPPRAWVVPLGVGAILESFGVARDKIHELDWWSSVTLGDLTITCTPAQHGSARTAFDRNKTLWAGFVVKGGADTGGKQVYFSGDTGYRAVEQSTVTGSAEESAATVCPAFKETRARLGAPDLALLPIGAYTPRGFMSTVHASPEDAVSMLLDLEARNAIAMHFGSLPLTPEPVTEPIERLALELARRGIPPERFVVMRHGDVWTPTGT